MINAIWGCGGTGKSAIACGLGNLYAARGTAAVIDTNLCQPTLPLRLPGVRLEAERSLGRYLNRLGDSEVRRYYHQHPDNNGLFFAGLCLCVALLDPLGPRLMLLCSAGMLALWACDHLAGA